MATTLIKKRLAPWELPEDALALQPPNCLSFPLEELPPEILLLVIKHISTMRWAEAFAMSLTSKTYHGLIDMSKVKSRDRKMSSYSATDIVLIANWPIYGGPKNFSPQNLPVSGRDYFACISHCLRIRSVTNFRTADVLPIMSETQDNTTRMSCLDCIMTSIYENPGSYITGLGPWDVTTRSVLLKTWAYSCAARKSSLYGVLWPFGGETTAPWYVCSQRPPLTSGGIGVFCRRCHRFGRVPDWLQQYTRIMPCVKLDLCVDCNYNSYAFHQKIYIQRLYGAKAVGTSNGINVLEELEKFGLKPENCPENILKIKNSARVPSDGHNGGHGNESDGYFPSMENYSPCNDELKEQYRDEIETQNQGEPTAEDAAGEGAEPGEE